MLLRVSDERRTTAVGAYGLALGHCLNGVVGALTVHVRLYCMEQIADRQTGKDHNGIDNGERRHPLRASHRWENRLAASLDFGDGSIVVDSHDEPVGFEFGSLQVSHVPHVEEVETAVGECDRFSVSPKRGNQLYEFGAIDNPSHVTLHTASQLGEFVIPHHGPPKLFSCNCCGPALHHHQPAGIVG